MQASMITALPGMQAETPRTGVPTNATGKDGETVSFAAVLQEVEGTEQADLLNVIVEESDVELPVEEDSEAAISAEQEAESLEVAITVDDAPPDTEVELDEAELAVGDEVPVTPNPTKAAGTSLAESLVLLQTAGQPAEAETVKVPEVTKPDGTRASVNVLPEQIAKAQNDKSPVQTQAVWTGRSISAVIAPEQAPTEDLPLKDVAPFERKSARIDQPQTTQPATVLAQAAQTTAVQQAFKLEANQSTENQGRFELSWPPAAEPRTQTAAQAIAPVQVQPAQPLVAPVQSAFSTEKEKSLQLESSRLGGDATLGSSATEAPRDLRQAVSSIMSTVATRADLPINVARQVAEAVHRGPGQSVELSLHPAELGRVRMTLSAAESGMTVMIQTERNETLDLMRRNIEVLEQAIGELGYQDIAFSFGADDRLDQERQENTEQTTGSPGDESGQLLSSKPQPEIRSAVGSVVGLDVRV